MYKWTLGSSYPCCSRVICNYFEESKALAPETLHQRGGVWSLQASKEFWRQKSVPAVAGGVQNCTFLCVIWARGTCVPPRPSYLPLLCYSTTPPCSLSTFLLWPEVVIDPSHFSKREGPALSELGRAAGPAGVDPEHTCAA